MINRRYRVEQLLGAGGLGNVYLCTDLSSSTAVAVKRLRDDIGMLPDAVIEQVRREAAILSQLHHRNIIQILDLGQDAHGLFYVLEFVDGPTLSHLIKYGPLNMETFYPVAVQCLEGISAAHRRNVLHLDLKPANIMLAGHPDPNFSAKILDFGLAKLGEEITTPREDELTVGSVYYISPEQLLHAPLDGRADLYSFGLVCYHLLLGEVAFPDHDPCEVREAQLHRPAPDLRSQCPHLPPALCQWVHQLIQKSPDMRPANAQEALNLLMRTMSHSTPPKPASTIPPASEKPSLLERSRIFTRKTTKFFRRKSASDDES